MRICCCFFSIAYIFHLVCLSTWVAFITIFSSLKFEIAAHKCFLCIRITIITHLWWFRVRMREFHRNCFYSSVLFFFADFIWFLLLLLFLFLFFVCFSLYFQCNSMFPFWLRVAVYRHTTHEPRWKVIRKKERKRRRRSKKMYYCRYDDQSQLFFVARFNVVDDTLFRRSNDDDDRPI